LLKCIIKLSDIIWYVPLENSIFAWQALKTKILKIASHTIMKIKNKTNLHLINAKLMRFFGLLRDATCQMRKKLPYISFLEMPHVKWEKSYHIYLWKKLSNLYNIDKLYKIFISLLSILLSLLFELQYNFFYNFIVDK